MMDIMNCWRIIKTKSGFRRTLSCSEPPPPLDKIILGFDIENCRLSAPSTQLYIKSVPRI